MPLRGALGVSKINRCHERTSAGHVVASASCTPWGCLLLIGWTLWGSRMVKRRSGSGRMTTATLSRACHVFCPPAVLAHQPLATAALGVVDCLEMEGSGAAGPEMQGPGPGCSCPVGLCRSSCPIRLASSLMHVGCWFDVIIYH